MHLDFKTVSNFRDASIHNMSSGKIFRSAKLSNLSISERNKLEDLNIYKVIDFRDPREIKKSPDNLSPYLTERYINLSISAQTLSRMVTACKDNKDDAIYYEKVMKESYKLYLENHKNVWKDFFKILISSRGQPILYHCTAGKDRTGIASYLIQSLCGVEENFINDSYLISNDLLSSKEAVSEQQDTVKNPDKLVTPLMLSTLGKVKISYLNSAKNLIKEKYLSVKSYFLNELGFNNQDLNELLTIYKK